MELLIVTIIALLTALTALATLVLLERDRLMSLLHVRKDDEANVVDGATVLDPKALMDAMGVVTKHVSGDGRWYVVQFQGGFFDILYNPKKTLLSVAYRSFAEYGMEYFMPAMCMINKQNSEKSHLTMRLRTVKDKKGERKFFVDIVATYSNFLCLKEQKDYTLFILSSMFESAHEFISDMKVSLEKMESEEMISTNVRFENRLARTRMLMDLDHLREWGQEKPSNDSLTVKEMLRFYARDGKSAPQRLTIVTDGVTSALTDRDAIMSLNVRNYLKGLPTRAEEVVMTMTMERSTMTVLLRLLDHSTDKTWWYSMSIMLSEQSMTDHSHTSLLEIRMADAEADYWEAKYMLDDARDKVAQGREREMTDEQRLAAAAAQPLLQTDLYWGKKFFNGACYQQALYFFFRAKDTMASLWRMLPAEQRRLYFRVCSYIGHALKSMGQPERAYYYLQRANELHETETEQDLIEVMSELEDAMLPDHLRRLLQQTHKHLTELRLQHEEVENEEEMESQTDFYNYLNRRMAYVMVQQHELDVAEGMLKDMLVNDTDVEFAQNLLERIKRMREQ